MYIGHIIVGSRYLQVNVYASHGVYIIQCSSRVCLLFISQFPRTGWRVGYHLRISWTVGVKSRYYQRNLRWLRGHVRHLQELCSRRRDR